MHRMVSPFGWSDGTFKRIIWWPTSLICAFLFYMWMLLSFTYINFAYGLCSSSSQKHLSMPSQCQHADFPTCTWTWWVILYLLLQEDTCICWPSSTGQNQEWPRTKKPSNVFCNKYSQDRSAFVCCIQIGRPILGITKSLTDTWCGNWEQGRTVSFLGIHKSDFWDNVNQPRVL
jgi:hypothetical protein